MTGRPPPLALAAVLAVLLVGCGSAGTPEVVRRLGGERRVGHYVSPFSYEHFLRGELALAHGDLETAAQEFELARAGPEEDPLVLSRLVDVLDRLGRRDEATDILDGAVQTFPDAEALWLVKGQIAERRGEVAEAIAAYERAEMTAPRSELAPIALATLLVEKEALSRADAVLARFLRRAPTESPEALRARIRLALIRGDGATAARAVRDLMRVAPARAEEIQSAAEVALGEGRPGLAAALLSALPPGNVDPILHVRALTAAGRFDRAEAVLAGTPADQLGGPAMEARLYLAAGFPERADEIAESVALTEPGPQAWLAGGLAKLALGEHAAAAALLARIPRGARGYAEARIGLAQALRAQALPALAAEVLERTLAGPVDDEPPLREALARTRLELGDVPGALDAVAPLPGARGRATRARILERAGRADEAAQAWAQVPPDATGLTARDRARARAERLLAEGDEEGARRVLRDRLSEAPEDHLTRARLDGL